jgi:hypothetical protein
MLGKEIKSKLFFRLPDELIYQGEIAKLTRKNGIHLASFNSRFYYRIRNAVQVRTDNAR